MYYNSAMTITFLGTNGWFDTDTGKTPCILIETKTAYIILDAGDAIYKVEQYITDEEKPIYLFISHLHLDHIFGLHILNKFHFPQGMHIIVPEGTLQPLKMFFNQPFTNTPEEMATHVDFMEVAEGEYTEPFHFSCFKMFHSSLNFGYRFMIEDKIISYSGDTGICDNSVPLALDADVLIHECSYESGHAKSAWGHVNPEEVATLAIQAHVKRLLLTHFTAFRDTRQDNETAAKKIFPNVISMKDDQQIEI